MPLLEDKTEELTDDEWARIKTALDEYDQGIFVTAEDVRRHIGL